MELRPLEEIIFREEGTAHPIELSPKSIVGLPIQSDDSVSSGQTKSALDDQPAASRHGLQKRPAEDDSHECISKRMCLNHPSSASVTEASIETEAHQESITDFCGDSDDPRQEYQAESSKMREDAQYGIAPDREEVLRGVESGLNVSALQEIALAQKPVPKLDELHLELVYHNSTSSGEFICRLCSSVIVQLSLQASVV